MKRLLILFAAIALAACTDNKPQEETQDYTSFVFENNLDIIYTNSVIGYFTEDGLCHKLTELGEIPQDHRTLEFIVEDESISELHFFCDNYGGIKLKQVFILKKNRKNTFKIEDKGSDEFYDKNDPTQYPQ